MHYLFLFHVFYNYMKGYLKNLKRKQLWLVTSDQSSERAIWNELACLTLTFSQASDRLWKRAGARDQITLFLSGWHLPERPWPFTFNQPSLLHLHVSIPALDPESVCGGSHCCLWEVFPGEPSTSEHAVECVYVPAIFSSCIRFMNRRIIYSNIIQSFTANVNMIPISVCMCYYKTSFFFCIIEHCVNSMAPLWNKRKDQHIGWKTD